MKLDIAFLVAREYPEEGGLWNPRDDEGGFEGGLQINLVGTRDHYLRMAELLRQFAELDTSGDSDFHEHVEGMMSADGKTRVHLILRKDEVGDGAYSHWLR